MSVPLPLELQLDEGFVGLQCVGMKELFRCGEVSAIVRVIEAHLPEDCLLA